MADPADLTDWAPGAPPPWLEEYGPPPVDSSLAGSGTVPPPPPDAAPEQPAPAPAPAPTLDIGPVKMPPNPGLDVGPVKMLPNVGLDVGAVHMLPPPAPAPATSSAPAPIAAPVPAPAVPAGLAAMQQRAQVAGVQPFAPPWLQQAEPPKPDAISGGPAQTATGETPDQSLARLAVDPNASVSDRATAWQTLTPEQRTNLVNSADPNQLAAIATAAMSPEELATIQVRHQQAALHMQSAAQLQLAQQADLDARRNFETYQASVQQANADTAQLEQDAQRLSQEKIDPNEHGVGNFIASVLTAAVGGAMSQYTGGRNLALDQLNLNTQRSIDAQKANIANQFTGLSFKRNLIAEQLQRSGDLYRAQETYRVSQYDRALAELQTKMQDYDPQGTTALRLAGVTQQVRAQRAQALMAYNQQQIKNALDQANTAKANADAMKAQADAAKTNAEAAKLSAAGGGAGAGSATNPSYTIATGLFNPWDPSQPIFAKHAIKDVGAVSKSIASYKDVQDQYTKLLAIAQRVNNDFSAGGQTWKRLQTTDEQEYEQARTSLIGSILEAKGMSGDLSTRNIEVYGSLVPDLQKILGRADTAKVIEDSQDDADRKIGGYLGMLGVDANPIIASARRSRAPAPTPSPQDQVAAAQEALAQNPMDKNAAAALDAARQRVQDRIVQQRTFAQDEQRIAGGAREYPKYKADDLPAPLAAVVADRNEAADTFNAELRKYRQIAGQQPKIDDKQKGEAAKEREDYAERVGGNAHLTIQYKAGLDAANDRLGAKVADLIYSSPDFGGVPADAVKRIATHLGFDASEFGNDMGGQVIRGEFQGALKRLANTPQGRQHISQWMFGAD